MLHLARIKTLKIGYAVLSGIIIIFFKKCKCLYQNVTGFQYWLHRLVDPLKNRLSKKKVVHRNEPPVKGGQNEAL